MIDKQPETLRLADELDTANVDELIFSDIVERSTAELRRLHEVNADLIDALQFCSGTSYISDAHEIAEEALAKAEGK